MLLAKTLYDDICGIAEDITNRKRGEDALWVIQLILEGRTDLRPSIGQGLMSWVHASHSGDPGNQGYNLTLRQEQILALVAEGKTNKEIASELKLSDKTVRNHLAALFEKLQVTRRTQAAAFFSKYKSA